MSEGEKLGVGAHGTVVVVAKLRTRNWGDVGTLEEASSVARR